MLVASKPKRMASLRVYRGNDVALEAIGPLIVLVALALLPSQQGGRRQTVVC